MAATASVVSSVRVSPLFTGGSCSELCCRFEGCVDRSAEEGVDGVPGAGEGGAGEAAARDGMGGEGATTSGDAKEELESLRRCGCSSEKMALVTCWPSASTETSGSCTYELMKEATSDSKLEGAAQENKKQY